MVIALDTDVVHNLYESNGDEESVQEFLEWAKLYVTSFVSVFNEEIDELVRDSNQFTGQDVSYASDRMVNMVNNKFANRPFHAYMKPGCQTNLTK